MADLAGPEHSSDLHQYLLRTSLRYWHSKRAVRIWPRPKQALVDSEAPYSQRQLGKYPHARFAERLDLVSVQDDEQPRTIEGAARRDGARGL